MGSFPGFAIGVQQEEQARARRQELADEKRKTTLKTLLEDAETPQDKVAAIEAVYHQDPSVLKQHVENLTRRLTGKGAQPVVSPADAQAGRLAPIAARGKTPAQQQLEQGIASYKGQLGAQREYNNQTSQDTLSAIQKIQNDPNLSDEQKQQQIAAFGVAAPRRASADELKRGDYQTLLASGQVPKDAQGNPLTYEAWVASQSAAGRAAGTPAKPQTPMQSYVSLTAKAILAKQGKGPPLTAEEQAQLAASQSGLTVAGVARAQAWAQAAAQYNLQAATDPNTGQDVLLTRAQLAAAANAGAPYLAGVVGAPTGMDKKNQMLAQSAIMQIETMENILNADPNLTGPGAGQLTQFQTWIGNNSEDSQQFLAAATFLSEHGVGVFGGRNIHTIQDLKDVVGSFKTNPEALRAALAQTKATMAPWAVAGGRLPAPAPKKAATGGGGTKGTVSLAKARSLPQNKGKSDAEITADAKKHGYEVVKP